MDLLQVAVTAVGAFAALFLLSKLMGHRQISELSVFDYVNGITIGSIAAEMATELEKPLRPLAAMVVWALLVWLLEALTSKCPRLRKYISGSPSIVFDNGKLYRRNMKKARLDLSEFLIQCRQQGFFDLGAIQTAVYEPDGRLTILPVAARRPATPEDMGIAPEKEQISSWTAAFSARTCTAWAWTRRGCSSSCASRGTTARARCSSPWPMPISRWLFTRSALDRARKTRYDCFKLLNFLK